MLKRRKKAKDFLNSIGLERFNNVLRESRLTPRQKFIAEMKLLKDWSYVKISLDIDYSEVTVKKDMEKVYDKVYNIFSL